MKAVSTGAEGQDIIGDAEAVSASQGVQAPASSAPAERIGVLVAGMHRSGTSAATRLLNIVGCDVAEDLVEGDQFNETGYWESEAVYSLNDRALASAGLSWNSWEPLGEEWMASPRYFEFRERAGELLQKQFAGSSLFVLKDPRVSRTLPVWLGAFEDLGIRPAFVFMYRNPAEVAASLLKRNGLNPTVGQLVWLRYVLDAEYHSRGLTRSLVYYPDLVSDWRSAADRLGQALGVVWPNMSANAQMQADGFLSPQLRHHDSRSKDTISQIDARSVPWVAETYALLADREGLEAAPARARLDQIRTHFGEASRNLFRVYSEFLQYAEQQNHRVNEFSESITILQGEIAQKNASMDILGEQIAQKNETIGMLSEKIDSLNQVIGEKQKAEATALSVYAEFKRSYAQQLQRVSDLEGSLSAERSDYEMRLALLNKRLRKIEKNIIWKGSYPLRATGSALSRGYKRVLRVFGIR